MVGIFLTILVLSSVVLGVSAQDGSLAGQDAPALQPSGSTLYLPMIFKRSTRLVTTFGVEMNYISEARDFSKARAGGVYWMRNRAIDWSLMEPTRTNPPTYDWSLVNEKGLLLAANAGMKVIAVIQFAPSWAQKYAGVSCGPIAQDSLDEFAQFVKAVVSRYSVAPYNVKYWELGNEPDIDHSLVSPSNIFGCWGEKSDDYYGGGYYAEMLKQVYPAIKQADPTAQVLIGGLLLDCDPTHPPTGKDCKPAKFLEGILRNGGGAYFDAVSFHGYPGYSNPDPGQGITPLYADTHFPSWEARGGVVLGKISFLREVMQQYGVNKPIFHTEGSLLCPENNPACASPGEEFYDAQADYVVWLFVRNIAQGVKSTIWYTFDYPGWRYSSLLGDSSAPRPAYYAYQFMVQILEERQYIGPVTQFPELLAYGFRNSQAKIWVMWAPDEQPHTITLPSGVRTVYNKFGEVITPSNGQITVSSPVYIELNP